MSNGEKQVFTLPKNVRRLKAIVIDEEDRLLLTATPNERFSQSVSTVLILFDFLSDLKVICSLSTFIRVNKLNGCA